MPPLIIPLPRSPRWPRSIAFYRRDEHTSAKRGVITTSDGPDFLPSSSEELSSVKEEEEPPSESTSIEEPVSDILTILRVCKRENLVTGRIRTAHWDPELCARNLIQPHAPEHGNVSTQPTCPRFYRF
ncbi:hypothetical protein M408DRAFT_152973 [Serendipita vermifera MAFF 305830]|uniref:Uncharacterized protein n=1 Tax=Serendipita vermifera MAFF 305830 TaxID=933852 RepID=A0A0C3BPG1_SERVB|nr:hypothetical protein M408DRAFT_152973 [Serendipita vermifera MAFF 305830]